MRVAKIMFSSIAALIFFAAGAQAAAQEAVAAETTLPESTDAMKVSEDTGWHPMLKAAANLSLGQTKNVPGAADGLTLSLGYLINGGLGYVSENKKHEWANTLNMQLAYTKTPVVDAMIKSLDTIDFKSSYLYHIPKVPWLGPFVSFRLTTAMLPGYDVRADDTNVLRLRNREEIAYSQYDPTQPVDADGAFLDADHPRVEHNAAGRKISLTDAFAPLTLRESVGFFAMPLDKPEAKLDIRLGFGAWETFVQDGYVIEDNEDTADFVELRQMQDAVQLGPELSLGMTGTVKGIVTYGLGANFMQPVYHTANTDLEGIDLLNMEFEILIGIQVAEWMSVDYMFKAVKQPLLIDEWQIQNGLLVSLTFNIVGGEELPPPCDCPACPEAPADEAVEGDADAAAVVDPAAEEAPPTPEAVPEPEAAPETPAETETPAAEPAAEAEAPAEPSA